MCTPKPTQTKPEPTSTAIIDSIPVDELACRVDRVNGRLTGLPSAEQIRRWALLQRLVREVGSQAVKGPAEDDCWL